MTIPATLHAHAHPPTQDRAGRGFVPATVAIAGLALTTSLLGLLTTWPYAAETAAWRLQAQGQDLGNLLAVLTLLAAVGPAARGSAAWLGVWAGAMLYLSYAFAIYALTVHFGALFLPYVAVLGGSLYAVGFGLRWREHRVRICRGPLILGCAVIASVAVLFAVLWLASIVSALVAGSAPAELAEAGLVANPVHVLDLAIVLPGMLITAVVARRGSGPSHALLGPWLGFTGLMGASVAITLVLASAWAPAAVVGALVVASVVAAVRVALGTTLMRPRGDDRS